ncbi:MAG: hypothetical protein WCY19_02315 [Candidatus Gastranaerophilaceae bacterium]
MGNDEIKVIKTTTSTGASTCALVKTDKDGKESKLTIFDRDGDGRIENHDGVEAKGNFTTDEIKNFLKEQKYTNVAQVKTTTKDGEEVILPDVDVSKDGKLQLKKDKEYNLGSLAKALKIQNKPANTTTSSYLNNFMPGCPGLPLFQTEAPDYSQPTANINPREYSNFSDYFGRAISMLSGMGTSGDYNCASFMMPNLIASMWDAAGRLFNRSAKTTDTQTDTTETTSTTTDKDKKEDTTKTEEITGISTDEDVTDAKPAHKTGKKQADSDEAVIIKSKLPGISYEYKDGKLKVISTPVKAAAKPEAQSTLTKTKYNELLKLNKQLVAAEAELRKAEAERGPRPKPLSKTYLFSSSLNTKKETVAKIENQIKTLQAGSAGERKQAEQELKTLKSELEQAKNSKDKARSQVLEGEIRKAEAALKLYSESNS